jgi:hypothetical protein
MFRRLFRSRRLVSSAPAPSLAAALTDARDRAAADADFALTPERAAAQRAAILKRLAGAEDSRVLSFPPRAVLGLSGPELADAEAALAPRRTARSPRPALGWLLTAAAAVYDDLPGALLPAAPRTFAAAPPVVTSFTADADDSILAEVEVALAGRGVEEFQPLDALTPNVSIVAAAGR